jgi:hypothetical protein
MINFKKTLTRQWIRRATRATMLVAPASTEIKILQNHGADGVVWATMNALITPKLMS